jgi:nitrite reductase/ring-hydroxylating ferredoxin subunit
MRSEGTLVTHRSLLISVFEHLPTKRRNILRALVVGGLTAFIAPFVYAIGKFLAWQGAASGGKSTATLSSDDLTPSSPSQLLEIQGEPIIVLREPNNEIRAFTATCTHLGCIVSYRPELLIGHQTQPGFYCKCHGGKYYANGVNVPGTRPPSPLTELTVHQDANDVTVSLTPKSCT